MSRRSRHCTPVYSGAALQARDLRDVPQLAGPWVLARGSVSDGVPGRWMVESMPHPAEDSVAKVSETSPHPTGRPVPGPLLEHLRDDPHDLPADYDGVTLMDLARSVRHRMRQHETALGLVFPERVRLQVALDAIEAGLTSGVALEVAVGYLMLRELFDEVGRGADRRP